MVDAMVLVKLSQTTYATYMRNEDGNYWIMGTYSTDDEVQATLRGLNDRGRPITCEALEQLRDSQ